MQLTDADVRAILDLLDATSFNELHLETDRFRLSLRRSETGWMEESAIITAPKLLANTSPTTPGGTLPSEGDAAKGATSAVEGAVEIRAPLPGTFYRAPKPGSPPFVEIGSLVEADTVLALVETMKLMNSVVAGVPGRVVEIRPQDAEFVDQHAVLVLITPLEREPESK
jgi:acetyl-CoA carboxylase biotin carboxyl carrier protein